ncbi:MAG: tRNA (adenosine(37)-N6)-threonylcarbamoyltransferase complex dimerization subunit type 1 TsaB [Bacteroidetes bacterium]|nr:MAG: tRNA (adenosine(37)-N6)-threonylcarbamoyltransferase complex dimerization subunit type 1 TsaB [Bacteroidota bacterium]
MTLSIDTSTAVCSVALHEKQKLLACSEILLDKSHSGSLTLLIEDLLKNTGNSFANLTEIAVSKGPGSYTGLRIGVSTAKGLCVALDLPLLSVGTLESMAFSMIPFFSAKTLFCPMIDARRMEVFMAIFDHELNKIQEIQALVLNENTFANLLEHYQIVFFGNGSEKLQKILVHQNAFFVNDIYPSAKYIGCLADASKMVDVAYFEPFYLKEFMFK